MATLGYITVDTNGLDDVRRIISDEGKAWGERVIKFKRLSADARLPVYATAGAACFDLFALSTEIIEPKKSATIKTGLCAEVPGGYAVLVFSRSGHGFKNGVRLGNCVGVIDSDYRGEWCIRIHNDGERYFVVSQGDRIAQAMLIEVPHVHFEEVSELADTARGEGGFGSTG